MQDRKEVTYRALPFDRCAISLSEYSTPVCLKEGVIFDLESLMEYLLKHKRNPITGEPASVRDIIRLNMTKSDDGKTIRSFFVNWLIHLLLITE